jgi:pimeloyl-ACP methyl ester carboxylesterase
MATFVIVHGAWGGAYSWNRWVVPKLRDAGHTVFAPTLTGLGERAHLASPDVTLDTHVQDVANVLFYEDLNDVILVGHSYGGMVITGVAGRAPERLSQLVYLDAFVPEDGQSLTDLTGPEGAARTRAAADAEGDGWRVPGMPPAPNTPADLLEWTMPRRNMQPIRTFTEPVRLPRGPIRLHRTYVYCSDKGQPRDAFAKFAARLRSDPAWRYYDVPTGHNLMYSAVDETVRVLREVAESR